MDFHSISERIKNLPAPPLWLTLLFSAIFLVLVIAYVIYRGKWGDIEHYFYQANCVFEGLVPYRDFVFEYPPFALFIMLIPRVFTADYNTYCYLQALMCSAFFLIGVWYLYRISEKFELPLKRNVFMIVSLLLFTNFFLVARNDVYPAVMCIIAAYYFLCKKYNIMWIILALATMIKIYPAVIVPIILFYFISKREYTAAAKGLLMYAAVCFIVMLPSIIADPSTAFVYLTYHAGRGLQVESVASSFILFANIFMPGLVTTETLYGTSNLVGSIPDAIASVSNYIMVAALLLLAFWSLWRMHKNNDAGIMTKDRCILILWAAMVMIFILFSKVFSAQYIIWAMALLVFAQMDGFDTKTRDTILLLMIPYGILSAINGYKTYFGLVAMETFPVVVIFVRNLIHIALTYLVLKLVYDELKSSGKHDMQSTNQATDNHSD